MTEPQYFTGFGNEFESECLPGALPKGRNNPKKVPYNLYTEQLSGTAFTKPRDTNRRTWLYRLQPSVAATIHHTTRTHTFFGHANPSDCQPVVDPLRWNPPKTNNNKTSASSTTSEKTLDFIQGCQLMCHAGSPAMKSGLAIYQYEFQSNMLHMDHDDDNEQNEDASSRSPQQALYNADGEFLIVPQKSSLEIWTELGRLTVAPQEICVIPRGMVFAVNVWDDDSCFDDNNSNDDDASEISSARGYMLEVYGGDGFQLPELGPIGSNGLANPRDFLSPTAQTYQASIPKVRPFQISIKMQSQLFVKDSDHSPFNVVAWHGNYVPYKYDLRRFCAVNSVTFDHLDPSIYTVLTCPSGVMPGTALADFVIFPHRWMSTDEDTFRPPWFHRNTMSEFMGLITGQYDAKQAGKGGFQPGGASLHNCMTPHGPDAKAYEKATNDPCKEPVYFDKGLAFMFETYLPLTVAPEALNDEEWRDMDYGKHSWETLTNQHFTAWDALQQVEQERADQRLQARKEMMNQSKK